MIPAEAGRTREDYLGYAKKNHIAQVLFIDEREA
jgi:hypothetical protein